MVMTAFFIVVLIGIGSFAIDLGRLFALKTQMQNAVDAAALAAAAELDGRPGALGRARLRARTLLDHRTTYTNDGVQALLASPPATLEDADFTFYSEIDPAKITTTLDADAGFVRVRLAPREINLFFLPVLEVLGINTRDTAAAAAAALAGTSNFVCDYPPLMICDPFEDPAVPGDPTIGSFKAAVTAGITNVGDMFVLKYQNQSWAPGDFAFLLPTDPVTGDYAMGAKELGKAIANPLTQNCTAGPVHTATGSVQSFPIHGMNTRFDEYGHSEFLPAQENAPGPVIIEYPRDSGWKGWDGGTQRFGDGNWNVPYRQPWEAASVPLATYWERYHERQGHGAVSATDTQPGISTTDLEDIDGNVIEWQNATRRDVHSWELRSELIPCDPYGPDGVDDGGYPNGDDIQCPPSAVTGYPGTYPATGDPNPSDTSNSIDGTAPLVDGFPTDGNMNFDASTDFPVSDELRRILTTAVIPCIAQDIKGSKPAIANDFAQFFVTTRATKGGGNKIDYVAEFMGLMSTGLTANNHTVIQLYE
ncbi:MAG: hypothetical protein B0D96_12380 [Candidatus Sedimenticola endophacoides]|nr:MAG: hypothetical protein B0D94_02685 [Candidatus Sedimenticola endophacoides]OQX33019.1 MAG: hypothetical protein B0D96_12380 [Candidatus Sedimenticola endophacoides]OQX42562.1 MAG: hypothetical protein B0D89_01010 [Candidatus Sedimenticola endophacoides]